MIKLAPSILSADFSILKEELEIIEKAGAQYVHIDVMDGHFVPNITLGPPVIKSLRKTSNLIFDVHLMIENPEQYIAPFAEAGADIINVHVEACRDLPSVIDKIIAFGKIPAVTIKPETDVDVLAGVLDKVKMVLIMSVNPGFGGQPLMKECLLKVERLSHIIKERNLDVEIEIDGGVNLENLEIVLKSGATVIVAGSAIFDSENTYENAKQFVDYCKGFEMR